MGKAARAALVLFVIGPLLVPCPARASERKPVELRETREPISLGLDDALTLARERHIEVIVAQKRVQQAIDRLGQAASPLLPHFSLTSSQYRRTTNLRTYGISVPGQKAVVGPYNAFDARMTLTQTLFDLAAFERLRSACASKRLAKIDQKRTEQDVLALVGTIYLEAKRASQRARLMEALVRRDEKRHETARAGFRSGLSTQLDVKQAEAELKSSQADLRSAETQKIERRLDLASALGLELTRPIRFSPETLEVELEKPTPWQALLNWEKTPDVESAKAALEVSRREKWAEVFELLPKAEGTLNYGASGNTPASSDDTYEIGAKVSLPVFEGGNRFFRIREAIHRLQENRAKLKDTERRTEAGILQALEGLEEALKIAGAKEAEFLAAAQDLELARDRASSGLGSELGKLEARARWALALDAREEAFALYQTAEISLARSMGRVETLIKDKEPKP